MSRASRSCGVALVAALGSAVVGCGGERQGGTEACSPTLYPAAGGVSDGVLRDVDSYDAGDVWAVGGETYFDEESSVVLRWDGKAWSRIESPMDIWYYEAVAVLEPDDVWAVGREGKSFGEARVTHWDGHAWSEPHFPAAETAHATSVAAVARDDVWVGGSNGTFVQKPYLAHWDGHSWTTTTPKERLPSGIVSELVATASNDVWAIVSVGDTADEAVPVEDVFRDPVPSVMLHWDGGEWTAIPSPGPYELGLATAVGPSDVWVSSGKLLHHWNGRRWTTVNPPIKNLYIDGLDNTNGVIWIAGTDRKDREIVARYDGSAWTQAALPAATLGADYRGVSAISERVAWAIGVRRVGCLGRDCDRLTFTIDRTLTPSKKMHRAVASSSGNRADLRLRDCHPGSHQPQKLRTRCGRGTTGCRNDRFLSPRGGRAAIVARADHAR